MSVVSRDPFDPITPEQWDELRRRWPDGERLRAAFELAPDLATCRDLLAGQPVDRDRLDEDGLRWATARRLVRLERPVDLFDIRQEMR